MAYGPVNVPGASQAEVEAVSEAAQATADKIGTTGDTGGSSTAGTVMGKLNKLISDLTTHMGRWTATRAGYIDTIKTDAAAAKSNTSVIGTTEDTGGSTTAGTAMGKLNKLIADLTANANTANAIKTQLADGSAKMGAVKSIQRGYGKFSVKYNQSELKNACPELKVSINPVVPEKCIVLLDGMPLTGMTDVSADAGRPYVYSFTQDTLTLREASNKKPKTYNPNNADEDGYITYTSTGITTWQVIEFY